MEACPGKAGHRPASNAHDNSHIIREVKLKLIKIYSNLIDIKIDKLKNEVNATKMIKIENEIDVLIERLESI